MTPQNLLKHCKNRRDMTLKEYFHNTNGIGVLSTADSDGKVDAAIYSTPHVFDDGTLAFIMRERLTHLNLQSNPYASFLFIENVSGYNGVRLFLKKLKEETDSTLIAKMTRRNLTPDEDKQKGSKYLVYFTIEKILPLIGSGKSNIVLS
jgi:mRNA deadenylase 3'-5' endonuclease subunit Ccr4